MKRLQKKLLIKLKRIKQLKKKRKRKKKNEAILVVKIMAKNVAKVAL